MSYWHNIDKKETKQKKESDSDIPYARVTSILSAHPDTGCEKAAYMAKNEVTPQYHTLTLAGTLVHWKIEKYLAKIYGFAPPPPFEETLEIDQLKLYREEIQKEDIVVSGRKIKRQRFLTKVDDVYNNFLKMIEDPNSFWNKYNVTPLYLERIVSSTRHRYAGTIDMIAKATIKSKEYIIIVDWKSGKTKIKDHAIQLTAYYLALVEMIEQGRIILPDLPPYSRGFCVRLGAPEVDEYLLTGKGNRKEFFRAKEVYDTVTNNAKGWHIRCMFCGYGYLCNR